MATRQPGSLESLDGRLLTYTQTTFVPDFWTVTRASFRHRLPACVCRTNVSKILRAVAADNVAEFQVIFEKSRTGFLVPQEALIEIQWHLSRKPDPTNWLQLFLNMLPVELSYWVISEFRRVDIGLAQEFVTKATSAAETAEDTEQRFATELLSSWLAFTDDRSTVLRLLYAAPIELSILVATHLVSDFLRWINRLRPALKHLHCVDPELTATTRQSFRLLLTSTVSEFRQHFGQLRQCFQQAQQNLRWLDDASENVELEMEVQHSFRHSRAFMYANIFPDIWFLLSGKSANDQSFSVFLEQFLPLIQNLQEDSTTRQCFQKNVLQRQRALRSCLQAGADPLQLESYFQDRLLLKIAESGLWTTEMLDTQLQKHAQSASRAMQQRQTRF